jgi:RNA recognition motif-containing protein
VALQGCGIVEFETPEQAGNAINTLHETEVRGETRLFIWSPALSLGQLSQQQVGARTQASLPLVREGTRRLALTPAARSGWQLDGRLIFVREDREDFDLKSDPSYSRQRQEGQPPKRGRPNSHPLSRGPPAGGGVLTLGKTVYVFNLSYDTSWQDLKVGGSPSSGEAVQVLGCPLRP